MKSLLKILFFTFSFLFVLTGTSFANECNKNLSEKKLLDLAESFYKSENYTKSLDCYFIVEDKYNDTYSQSWIGVFFERGLGVKQDYKEAAKWFQLAAEQGDDFAQHNLALMYSHGKGVTQDYQEAVKWYLLSAEQGNANAQHNLARLYAEGQGVTKDYVLAHMWFNIAFLFRYEDAKQGRDFVELKMTSEQLLEAQNLTRECIKKNYKNCGY